MGCTLGRNWITGCERVFPLRLQLIASSLLIYFCQMVLHLRIEFSVLFYSSKRALPGYLFLSFPRESIFLFDLQTALLKTSTEVEI